MSKEHEIMERIAVDLDAKADDIFADIANGEEGDDDQAQAYRRCAEIIRYQVECEA
jgi:hypothetical protein